MDSMSNATSQDVINALAMRGLTMNPAPMRTRGECNWAISGDQQDGRRFVVEISDHRVQRVRSGQDSIGSLIDAVLRAAVRAEDIRRGREAIQQEQDRQQALNPVSYGLPPRGLQYVAAIREDPDVPDD